MASNNDMVRKFLTRRKRKPPGGSDGAPTYLVPGYGDYQQTKGMLNAMGRHPNDGAPRPRYGAQRAPYSKGQRFKRKHPYKTQRGDARRPHLPTLN